MGGPQKGSHSSGSPSSHRWINMKLLPVLAVLVASAATGLGNRLVCHYTNWSRFAAKFNVEDIDPTLCSHIVYSFMGLDDEGRIRSVDAWNDLGDEWTEGGLKKFLKLKARNPSVKLLIGVGGWNEGPIRFQSMVRSPQKRRNFLESTLSFVRQYKFDGLEIDWIYHSNEATPADKAGLSELLKEMKPRYQEGGLLLSLATSANPTIIEISYDVPTISQHVDFLNVLTYDFHGSWDRKTGHVAPLYLRQDESGVERYLNVETAINMYLHLKAAPEKLNVALVAYGRTFTLADENNYGLGAPSRGPGPEEPLPYRSFCLKDKDAFWKKMRNDEQKIPYAVSRSLWVGYEDVDSLKAKVGFTKSQKLGGVSFWSLDMDDFKGACGAGKFPLLRAVQEELRK